MLTERHEEPGLSRAEAAEALDVSVRTVARYIEAGHLTAKKRKNGRIVITEASVKEFLAGEPALAEGGEQG
ncbi:helix-turn-helix domain-containing protein [Agromyces sp. NPDC058136]|uniref:helix-turn-helix domain-containing protein n=1 Tax=Agromyces sp. NPDC058136 TaxID=3346354 RepID=UPI0036D9295D